MCLIGYVQHKYWSHGFHSITNPVLHHVFNLSFVTSNCGFLATESYRIVSRSLENPDCQDLEVVRIQTVKISWESRLSRYLENPDCQDLKVLRIQTVKICWESRLSRYLRLSWVSRIRSKYRPGFLDCQVIPGYLGII